MSTSNGSQAATLDAARKSSRRPRKLARLALVFVSTVLGLELLLQVGALGVWWLGRQQGPIVAPSGRTILCVGDSWTHGMGTSDPSKYSYPAVLQKTLDERPGDRWTVVNGGQSGQNSRDVLQRLPSQLAEYRPQVVCVLVGRNDFWSMPEELAAQSGDLDHRAYRFRWRIPRLVAWIAASVSSAEAAAAPRATMSGPEWEPRRINHGDPYPKEPYKWRTTPPSQAHKNRGWKLHAEKDTIGAAREFELAVEQCPEDATARQGLAIAYRMSDRLSDMQQQLDWLRDSWKRDADYRTGRSLLFALDDCGCWAEAAELAARLSDRFPLDGLVWRYRAQAEFFIGNHDAAAKAADKAIELAPDRWAYFIHYKVQLHGFSNPDEAIRSVFAGYVALNDAQAALADLRGLEHVIARMRPVLESYPCEADVKNRLSTIIAEIEATHDGVAVRAVLTNHLSRIISLARGAGATPVFLTYPVAIPAEATLQSVASAEGVAFVGVRERFTELLAGRPWEEFKAPDGHCNDAGYALMAQAIAEGLQPLLAK